MTICAPAALGRALHVDSDLLAGAAFISIILLAVLAGYAIEKSRFRYATPGSAGLLLGLLVACLFYFYARVICHESDPVPFRLVQLNE
jgi:hypothetical protein